MPMEVRHEEINGALPPAAVDMTLVFRPSLDKANTLPKYSQPRQQQAA